MSDSNESDRSWDTTPTSARPSLTAGTSESPTTVDIPQEDFDGRNSSSYLSPPSTVRRRRRSFRRKQGFMAFVYRLVLSDPKEHQCLKACIAFPIGALISLGLFYSVIYPLEMKPVTRDLLGGCLGVALSLGFAFSVEVCWRSSAIVALGQYGETREKNLVFKVVKRCPALR